MRTYMLLHKLLTGLSILFLFNGCNQQEVLCDASEFNNELYKDSTYLCFEGDLSDPGIIWSNMGIYASAYDRMIRHLRIQEKSLVWDFENAIDLNISTNIYNYIISCWEYVNKQLENSDNFLEMRGSYFILGNKKQTKSTKPKPKILFEGGTLGTDANNMSILSDMVREGVTGWTGDYIDLIRSRLRPDGYGGMFVKGSGTKSNTPECIEEWGYIFYNACPLNLTCEDNYMVAFNTQQSGPYFYEKIMNRRWAPLITLVNRINFENLYKECTCK